MFKKIVLPVGLIVTSVIFITLLLKLTQKENIKTPVDENNKKSEKKEVIKQQKLSKRLNEYIDPSGFIFKFPDNFNLKKGDVNEKIYSALTLSSEEINAKTTILVEATSSQSLEDWLLQNAKNLTKVKLIKIKLADVDARQYEKDGQLVTLAFDTGVIITITTEMRPDNKIKTDLHKLIVNSFSFQAPEIPAQESGEVAGEADVIFEGEEVIE